MARGKKPRMNNSGKTATSVNPQGLSEDEANQQPTSQLGERAKKKNTRV
jgi:small acid-soluble spore protein L (minor)